MSAKSQSTLQSLTAAGKAAAAVSRSAAVDKLQSPAPVGAPTPATPDSGRERLNLYLTGTDAQVLRDLRKLVMNETGDAASGNSLIVTALRALDLKQKTRLLEIYQAVQASDGRRKQV